MSKFKRGDIVQITRIHPLTCGGYDPVQLFVIIDANATSVQYGTRLVRKASIGDGGWNFRDDEIIKIGELDEQYHSYLR